LLARPTLALLPAAGLSLLAVASRSRLALAASIVWALYALYEFTILKRWACSGECNIRVDLLLLVPGLLVLAALGTLTAVRRLARRPST
jgi:hypothetical protein